MRNFMQMLEAKWAEGKFVCVGLDPALEKIPECVSVPPFLRSSDVSEVTARIVAFNIAIVDATKDLVCAYKPNLAFYAAYGVSGLEALAWTMMRIRIEAPNVPVILDAKYADIGHTNEGYAKFAFDMLGADAITVHPYLGAEAMKPFLDRADKGVIVLCRTSNKGASEFQDVEINVTDQMFADLSMAQAVDNERYGMSSRVPLYQYVARLAASRRAWNVNGNCAVVVGATYPAELARVRKIVGDMPILIPGIGAQGGDLEATVKAGRDSHGRGMIINSSRDIIYASKGEDFAEAARRETQKLHTQITACLSTEA
ncbi:MAG: orotidine-5'-phosphate decarboxylase [Candidatus Uhrbacteria bacterium]|nr:orotidine-5'-phosphate decarboxylase [Candidatus Uhrbacteria bacterium]